MRPQFIPRELFRQYLTLGQINKIGTIGGIQIASYISRCEKDGHPLKHQIYQGSKRWRMLDVVARARAECLSINPHYAQKLEKDITCLEAERDLLIEEIAQRKHRLALTAASVKLTGSTLLTESEIADARMDLPRVCGVYFLLDGRSVVYVGQSNDVFSRVTTHMKCKEFDGYTYIPCTPSSLDAMESLYIHVLRPKLNGTSKGERIISAPLRLDDLLSGVLLN